MDAKTAGKVLEGLEKRGGLGRIVRNFATDRALNAWIKAQGPDARIKVTGPYLDGPKWAASVLR